ncbi:transcriptional regulator FtsR [Actinomyces weissii]|uniref:MerR family transcriptional regulator n=1 Tax=Actinomyces weissii TaxID=675090 RepID=A0A7T7S162_9ACTO|nr:MerR family transcriptional regulator [Actinomyces weissii]QQM66556.1 MerR family transcriptional regulator [Actinomyces weissii]
MKIGQVVDELKREFPALSISKVRYLETEGLIAPHRVGNGYRRYSRADVERLRYALSAQRDEYLPLSVIRERLEQLDQDTQAKQGPRVVARHGQTVADGPLGLQDLVERCGASVSQIEQLIEIGLVSPNARGLFGADSVRVVSAAMAAVRGGIPLRNLRGVRMAAERQADMIDQAVIPARARSSSAAADRAAVLAGALAELHGALLRRSVSSLG